MDLTVDEICELIDCVNNRIEDLMTCSMYGDGEAIEGEIKSLENLLNRLEKIAEALTLARACVGLN